MLYARQTKQQESIVYDCDKCLCVTTVGGILSKCCPTSGTNLTIGWVSQSATVHNC